MLLLLYISLYYCELTQSYQVDITLQGMTDHEAAATGSIEPSLIVINKVIINLQPDK